ncbi:BZ3500_MvSof-1268-A1-R1_Chr6-2g08422 [Microbotryum saponariae]|uniref:BZ3500_MvSof-1268-A1-R1_Chr6-2g08422 protein n=1 Tax=Microbotryum saponariae TaxID=289078 RepID=A0A2X0LNZ2_9BASI|nr:BZ3500_MvSof-1268-A1-R1_Chr6-2g08422 [Microbotryum saponariae]SDA07699.1 BZ3501_MvSof-1269-A2-R1_Chr6-1g08136 [Microbotryum saponariae]
MGSAPPEADDYDLPLYSVHEDHHKPLLLTDEEAQTGKPNQEGPSTPLSSSSPSSSSSKPTVPPRYSISLVIGPEPSTRPSHFTVRIHGGTLILFLLASLFVTRVVQTLSCFSPKSASSIGQSGKSFTLHPSTAKIHRGIDWSEISPEKVCEKKERRGIDLEEFAKRRDTLAGLLSSGQEDDWGVWVSEPSPNTLYYVNLSTSDWYLSERPWLVVITPSISTSSPKAHLSILTPSFELSRTKRLPFALSPSDLSQISWVTWEEAENPYAILSQHLGDLYASYLSSIKESKAKWTIHLEENTRQLVADGIGQAMRRGVEGRGLEVKVGLVGESIREQRMRKTKKERELLRCVSKVTMHALRKVQTHLQVGMSEKQGEALIYNALTSAGLTDLSIIVLFGANAALPHASASADKWLEEGEFALFDVGGTLKGYISDFTRTMLPNPRSSLHPSIEPSWPSRRSQTIWNLVHDAQATALRTLDKRINITAAEVDLSARRIITDAGYGDHFTHRLGHGIGLQGHEGPYLNSGNSGTWLKEGEVFSIEPGVYLENQLGVRLEDLVIKTEEGYELVWSAGLAKSPWLP